jgi:hypothetical protein
VSDLYSGKHDELRISRLGEITIDWSDESENASDSIHVNREFDSNEIGVSDFHHEKHDERTISMSQGIWRCDDFEKLRVNLWSTTSISKAGTALNSPRFLMPTAIGANRRWQLASPNSESVDGLGPPFHTLTLWNILWQDNERRNPDLQSFEGTCLIRLYGPRRSETQTSKRNNRFNRLVSWYGDVPRSPFRATIIDTAGIERWWIWFASRCIPLEIW